MRARCICEPWFTDAAASTLPVRLNTMNNVLENDKSVTMSDPAAEVILKISERCNLGCTYCYFFERADQSFRRHPPRLELDVAAKVAEFIASGCRDLGLKFVRLDLHGGEPLLVGKQHFTRICTLFEGALRPITNLELTVQTNAALIDEEWIRLFELHHIKVGVSLDGPPEVNDRHRLDLAGRGSYARSAAGIRLLQSSYSTDGRPQSFGLLCVIDPSTNARAIYEHFTRDLGLRRLDFLLPNATHDDVLPYSQADLGRYLCELFDAWTEAEGYRQVRLRLLESMVAVLLGDEARLFGVGTGDHMLATVSTDGSLSPDDTLRSCGEKIMNTGLSVHDSSFREFLASTHIRRLERARTDVCEACNSCAWYQACGGSFLVNRYSRARQFLNPSIHCEAIKTLLAHTSHFLMNAGLGFDELCRNLSLNGKEHH